MSTIAATRAKGSNALNMRNKSTQVLDNDAPRTVGWRNPAESGGNVDRRRSSRFRLRLPVLTQWTDAQNRVRYGGGFSRDICLRGLFVVSSDPPPVATMITVTVVLPNVRAGSQEIQLHSVGSIVRIEHEADAKGYAVNCHFSDIEELVRQAQ